MTREDELRLIDEAVAAGRVHQITHEEALAYILSQSQRASAESSARMRRVNAAVGNAMARLKRERAYAKERTVSP